MSEQNCIHGEVCKYKQGGGGICTLKEICKFSEGAKFSPAYLKEEPVKPRRKEKRKYKKRAEKPKNLTASKEEIKRVRNLLRMRRVNDLLTEDEMKALDMHAGKHYEELSETARQQILDIEKESKNRMEEVE
ncbi:hypothetical protein LCGC14_0398970 [marine sediment metagenome]|uniref:Uncharacterized protein n=1 Tax=marine sediment metagenome TaxID=412755 RepID=A0A0F9VJ74_9ZZZZ